MSKKALPITARLAFDQLISEHSGPHFPKGLRLSEISPTMVIVESAHNYDCSQICLSLQDSKEYNARSLTGVISSVQSLAGLDTPLTEKQEKNIQNKITKAVATNPNCVSNVYALASNQAKSIAAAIGATEVVIYYNDAFHCTVVEFVNKHSYDGVLVWRFHTQNNSYGKIKKE